MAFVNLLSVIYPVGAVYFSINNTSPASIVGGSWTQLTGGCLGLAGSAGFAASGANGGSKKISTNQMPSHSHEICTDMNDSERAVYHFDLGNIHTPFSASRSPGQPNSVYLIAKAVGGGKIIYLLTLLSTVGRGFLNLYGGEIGA